MSAEDEATRPERRSFSEVFTFRPLTPLNELTPRWVRFHQRASKDNSAFLWAGDFRPDLEESERAVAFGRPTSNGLVTVSWLVAPDCDFSLMRLADKSELAATLATLNRTQLQEWLKTYRWRLLGGMPVRAPGAQF